PGSDPLSLHDALPIYGSAAAGAASLAVPLLVGGLGDDRDDVAIAQVLPDSARRVGLVAADAVGSGAGSAGPAAGDAEVAHQDREHRCVTGLPGADEHDQRTALAIDEVMDLRRQSAP